MVVFFDIDGTIVDDKTQIIPESTVRAVKKLTGNGHIAVVNTGRPFSHIDPRVRALPFSGWICGCGMEIWLRGQRIHYTPISPALCAYVRDSIRKCGMQVLYEAEQGAILSDGTYSLHPLILKKRDQMEKKGFTNLDINSLSQPEFMKFMSYDWPGCDRGEFVRRMEPYFDPIDRGPGRLEFTRKGCSKSVGISILMKHLGTAPGDTLAIGDSANDLPMFQVVRHSACMGDGAEELKAVSEMITDSVLCDGVEKALKHFGLI